MLVKELLQCMHPTQIARVYIYEYGRKPNKLFDDETKGNPKDLSIPEEVLNREVYYYYIDHPYIKSELEFKIFVKEESDID